MIGIPVNLYWRTVDRGRSTIRADSSICACWFRNSNSGAWSQYGRHEGPGILFYKYIRDAMDMVCCMRMQKMVMVMKKEITVLQICSGRRKLSD